MINSHLLYRLSYRGTSFFQPWTLPVLLDSRLRGAPFYGCARACQPSDPKVFFFPRATKRPFHCMRQRSRAYRTPMKSPPKRGFPCPPRRGQAKTISSPSTFAEILAPGANLPARISCASGFSIQRWMARFSGRAP